ncbi:hypothetical protein B0H10DRAFT_2220189 [Mycena sp. CBHHK59/15]|nr:hypothetical protein B0H10DRAFT_2234716 [Mycena sp. CBHHK59/15]KAJ6615709.1 hypothetical protein B0H10DRAFT_2220189 [Mycena sp. CBHHK59/15]
MVVELMWRQDSIESLHISEFNETEHKWPVVFLPNLARVEARPKNLAFLVASRPVKHVKFMYLPVDFENRPVIPLSFIITSTARVTSLELQLSQLLNGIPADLVDLLPDVKQLFITQDASWGSKRSPLTNTTTFPVAGKKGYSTARSGQTGSLVICEEAQDLLRQLKAKMELIPSHTPLAAADHPLSCFGLDPEYNPEVLHRARERDWLHLEPMMKKAFGWGELNPELSSHYAGKQQAKDDQLEIRNIHRQIQELTQGSASQPHTPRRQSPAVAGPSRLTRYISTTPINNFDSDEDMDDFAPCSPSTRMQALELFPGLRPMTPVADLRSDFDYAGALKSDILDTALRGIAEDHPMYPVNGDDEVLASDPYVVG